MHRIKEYKMFERKLYSSVTSDMQWTTFGTAFKLKNGNETIGVCCLNSAWRCYGKSDIGNLIIGEEQLNKSFKYIEDCQLKIALVHHPLDGLAEVERSTISHHIHKDFDLLLLGHSHETITTVQTGFTGTLFINLAPSGLNDIRTDSRTFANGFTVIDFSKPDKQIDCSYWRYNHDKTAFVPNTDTGVDGEGNAHYIIPSAPTASKRSLIEKLLKTIQEDHFPKINEHLIGARADVTKITIKEGFVLPPIDKGGSVNAEENQEEIISISQIVKSKFNLFFFGNSESGKTALLFRLIREYVDEFEYIRKIPVYIDFNEIGHKDIDTCLREFLKCGSSEMKYLLEENQIVLLIDNLQYDKKEDNRNQIKKLHRFLFDYPNIQVIATSECDMVGILPSDYVELCEIPFQNYFIKNLRAKEIKALMKMWMPNEKDDLIKTDERLDRMLTSFESYALSSTAMSVSLFLWSTEYSQKKPINNAVLLEIYIEIILEKLSKENIYRGTFDFTNKLQLLAKISQEMLLAGQQNYSIKYSEYIGIIENYLENLVGFEHDAKVIADYFIDRKILVKYQSNRVKFSNSCFFHFFLAKRMEYDMDFREHVLSEDEYYKFYKEIDYYTGLTRSDRTLFELIFERFEEAFQPTDFILDIGDIDEYFTVGKGTEPVARKVEVNKITENRPSEEMLEDLHNRRLEQIPNPGTIMKMDGERTLERLLIIMCNVLRNSEGVEDLSLKRKSYYALIKYAMVLSILHKESIIDYVVKNQKLPSFIPQEIDLINYLTNIPLFLQMGMYRLLGTPKLNSVISEKIRQDFPKKSVSDIESFFSVALYSDLQGKDFPRHLKLLIKRLKNNANNHIVCDYVFFKLIDYYYRRTRSGSPNEEIYLDLLAELRIKSQKLPKRMKEKVIKSLVDAKKDFQKSLGF